MEVKTYTSIFDKAKAAYGTGAYDDATLEFLFPDLKVSEDERIRKAIIHYILYETKGTISEATEHTWVKWLEKQKEQTVKTDACGFPIRDEGESACSYLERCLAPDMRSIWYEACKEIKEKFKPTTGWSEEDEKLLDFWLDVIDRNDWRMDENFCKASREFINWLKSLRPVSKDSLQSWKPSEAHLSALLAVLNDPNNIGSQTCQLALTDLYEQLNKL